MAFRALAVILIFLSFTSYAKTVEELCHELSPDPDTVKTFYEDNPTYLGPKPNPAEWLTSSPESQGLKSENLNAGASVLEATPHALSFLVLKNNHLVYERYFNGSRDFHSNNIHSASKSLLGLLIGIAVDQGYIKDIDLKISNFLADSYAFPSHKSEISVRHLLTMTSGFAWTEDISEDKIERKSNWVEAILKLKQSYPAGTHYNYNTGGTHLLSAILTEATKTSTCAFAIKYLFEPLGIQLQHWGRDPQGNYSGGYNVYLRAKDFLKLGKLYLEKGKWNGNSIVSPQWISDATRPAVQTNHPQFQYGYLLWLLKHNNKHIYKMWGYGGQYIYIIPEENLVALMTFDTKKEYPEYDGDKFLLDYVAPNH